MYEDAERLAADGAALAESLGPAAEGRRSPTRRLSLTRWSQ
jgi:hypothetical protein